MGGSLNEEIRKKGRQRIDSWQIERLAHCTTMHPKATCGTSCQIHMSKPGRSKDMQGRHLHQALRQDRVFLSQRSLPSPPQQREQRAVPHFHTPAPRAIYSRRHCPSTVSPALWRKPWGKGLGHHSRLPPRSHSCCHGNRASGRPAR